MTVDQINQVLWNRLIFCLIQGFESTNTDIHSRLIALENFYATSLLSSTPHIARKSDTSEEDSVDFLLLGMGDMAKSVGMGDMVKFRKARQLENNIIERTTDSIVGSDSIHICKENDLGEYRIVTLKSYSRQDN